MGETRGRRVNGGAIADNHPSQQKRDEDRYYANDNQQKVIQPLQIPRQFGGGGLEVIALIVRDTQQGQVLGYLLRGCGARCYYGYDSGCEGGYHLGYWCG